MPTQLISKLTELAYNEIQSDLSGHEIEGRLVDNLLGKSLNFTTEQGTEASVKFHSIGRGKKSPSTVVTLKVNGIEFEQDEQRLSLDLRYVFYREYGHDFLFTGTPTKFLVTSPFVQELGPSNFLIEFVIYGNTINHVNRCLSVFADVLKSHQGEVHQTAIEWYDDREDEWEENSGVSLEELISETDPTEDPIEYIYTKSDESSYIEEYIEYIDNSGGEARQTIDSRNTYAESEL